MWGCRLCDWDVCEGRCHPEGTTLADLRSELKILAERVQALVDENPSDLRTKLALVETDVHKLEKKLDNATASDLAKWAVEPMSEDEARARKKALITDTEDLLSRIEGVFQGLRDATAAAAE